jgi:hypothetical protein
MSASKTDSHREAIEAILGELTRRGYAYDDFKHQTGKGERIHVTSYRGVPLDYQIEGRGNKVVRNHFLAHYGPTGARNEFFILVGTAQRFLPRFYVLTSKEALARWEHDGKWGRIGIEGLVPDVEDFDKLLPGRVGESDTTD